MSAVDWIDLGLDFSCEQLLLQQACFILYVIALKANTHQLAEINNWRKESHITI